MNQPRTINHCLANGRGRGSLDFRFNLGRFWGTTDYTRTPSSMNCESICVGRKTDKIWFSANGLRKTPSTPTNQLLSDLLSRKCIQGRRDELSLGCPDTQWRLVGSETNSAAKEVKKRNKISR
ncbi:hypothetical protein AVEN_194970-1 [Araneus ventricosus]|uniref:Uncharacterized protein n=1 Tax=Araneus ventricosus TaxID=182803 RepID=A0A4Y2QPU3_ARAVE|nr:hypothetical protein AVEN_194970-1 [Araneus ventricosus]